MYKHYNPNPKHKQTTDCVIRMLTKVFQLSWIRAYDSLSEVVAEEYEMPSSNHVWELYLLRHGFQKKLLPNTCPDCLTVRGFTYLFPAGTYVACTGSHVVAVVDGDYFDAWDSGNEIVSYYFQNRI